MSDPDSACPQQSLIRRDLGNHLRRELAALDDRERDVIRVRFGLDGDPPRTLREAAALLGLSRERIRQIELAALLKIRRLL
jgi:RNA polymerase sigma factor (sigma-70 family)